MSETPPATPCNIAAALPRLARERPEQVAMRCPGRNGRYEVALTYAQLDARSDAIATGLIGIPMIDIRISVDNVPEVAAA